jgi:hypothetical protein
MSTPDTTPPATGITSSSIAESGAGLIRLWVAAFSLPLKAGSAVGATFNRVVNNMTAALDGAPLPDADNDIVKTGSDLVKATSHLYTSLLNAAISSLEGAARSIDSAVKK